MRRMQGMHDLHKHAAADKGAGEYSGFGRPQAWQQ